MKLLEKLTAIGVLFAAMSGAMYAKDKDDKESDP